MYVILKKVFNDKLPIGNHKIKTVRD